MSRRKSLPRIICCASIVALSLTGCSSNPNKLKGETNLTDNVPPESTQSGKFTDNLHFKKKSSRSTKSGSSSKYENLWERLFDHYDLPAVNHPDIDRELAWFVDHPDYIERVQSRAEPFLYSIVRQVEKHEVPGELALLPVIESAFKPHAISPAHAAGIWQFIPSTGRLYGLKKSRSYDGRRDVYASTRAAIKYLKKLHTDFGGDWLLAIAAYNCGEGAVSRAIQRNEARGLPTDFWSLNLPRETRTYVPRLLAVSRVFANADRYGIDLREIPNKALFKTVVVKSQLDLALAADEAGLSLDQMMELNPGFKHKVTDVHGSYRLYVPAHKYRSFKEALPRLVEAGIGHGRHSDVEDSLYQDDLITAATEASADDSGRIEAGSDSNARGGSRSYRSYRETTQEEAASSYRGRIHDRLPMASKSNTVDAPHKNVSYTVQKGDTLFSIARKNGVGVDELREMNHMSAKTPVKWGQQLVIGKEVPSRKTSKASLAAKEAPSLRYKVKRGDSLSAISKKFNVTLADLRKWNGAGVVKQFRPGMDLTVSEGD